MKVIKKGSPPYKIGIVCCTHGDEAAGKKAVEKLLQKHLSFDKGVKFVFANEKAYKQEKRYVDADLNRSFPGDKDSDNYEERIAAEIMEELQNTEIVLDLHETTVEPSPFALYTWNTEEIFEALQKTNLDKAVEISYTPGCGINHYGGIEVETGPKNTEKSNKMAYQILKQFLINYNVLNKGKKSITEPELYSVYGEMKKPEGEWNVKVENFLMVQHGETVAEDSETVFKADRSFIPVLFDEVYTEIFGFKAVRLEKVEDRVYKQKGLNK